MVQYPQMKFAAAVLVALLVHASAFAGAREVFQTVLMRLALCGLAASLVLLALRSRIARDTFARLLSIWRSLTAFGRVAVCSFLLIGVLVGGDKTNNVPPNMNSPLPQMQQGGVFLTGFTGLTGLSGATGLAGSLPHTPSSLNPVNLVNPVQDSFAAKKAANWNVRGAWKDSFWLDFEDGWVFPWGTNHLSGVEVISYGQVWASPFDTNAIASAGAPVEIVPGLTTFAYEFTPSNSYRFVWIDAAINRDTNNLVSAALELFRNGDVSVTTNGVAAFLPRPLPFPHSGFGQDDEWVTANFTNATEILAVGYPQWVDAQVGEGLTNGLYKLSVTVSDDPPETTFLSVGDLSVAITNAGEYVFLLEKGPAYDLTVFPPSSNVTISAVDDVPTMRGQPMMRSFGDADGGQWVPDSGSFWTDYAAGVGYARLWWLPWLCGSPDVVHIDPTAAPVTFHANLIDYRGSAASFLWAGSDALTIASPNSQTTTVTADLADWRLANLSVTASFDFDRSLTSYLYVSYGTNDSPQVSCSLSVQSVHFINEGDRPERVYPVSVSLLCPVETNGVVDISHEGSDGALFWSDAAATQPLSSLSGISLSSVTDESGGASYAFYMTSPNIGSGSFTVTFTLPSGETRGAAKSYRAIEPIRRLVCSEIDPEYSCVFNPSRLVYGHPARLKVGVNGNFSPSDVEWSIVSGPGTVTRGEDDFGDADWTATVTATSTNGEVVVEARFNEDPIQPRFVLPIVQQRTLPVRAFVVNENTRPIVSAESIQSKIDYANVIFSQIGIQLSLLSISNNVGTAADLILPKEQLYTNSTGRAYWARSEQATALLNTYSEGDCIELYFVKEITGSHDSDPAAYKSPLGIVISKNSSDHVVAHEIGHALGLEDCYIANKRFSPPIYIAGMGDLVSSQMFDDKCHDWGLESDRGFYPAHEAIATTLPQMVMYGVDAGDSHDIPSGSVYSLRRNANASNRTFSSKVGANFIKVDITEVYSR